jgi:hypothetical protein
VCDGISDDELAFGDGAESGVELEELEQAVTSRHTEPARANGATTFLIIMREFVLMT